MLAPRSAVLLAAGGGIPVAGLLPISLLGELISTGTLIAFATVCASLIVFRRRHPEWPRPFRVPFWRVTPVLGIVMSLFVLYSMGLPALERILAWQVVGFVVYLSVKRPRRAALASAG